MMKKKAEATVLVRVKGKLEVELTRAEAQELSRSLDAALGTEIMAKLEKKLAMVERERRLDNATPFHMIPPVIFVKEPPVDPMTIRCKS